MERSIKSGVHHDYAIQVNVSDCDARYVRHSGFDYFTLVATPDEGTVCDQLEDAIQMMDKIGNQYHALGVTDVVLTIIEQAIEVSRKGWTVTGWRNLSDARASSES